MTWPCRDTWLNFGERAVVASSVRSAFGMRARPGPSLVWDLPHSDNRQSRPRILRAEGKPRTIVLVG